MDANKFDKLVEIGYVIAPHCGICIHADIAPREAWGICKVWLYQHLKHSKTDRSLSIYRHGHCKKYAIDPLKVLDLHGFQRFVEDL